MPARWARIAALALCAAATGGARADAGPRLELELAGGFGKAGSTSQFSTPSPYPWAPILTGRAGVELWGFFTPSVRVFTVAGSFSARPNYPDAASQYRAISGLLELRVHSSGDTQGYLGAAAGVGHVLGLQRVEMTESHRIGSQAGPAFLGVLGVRRLLSPSIAAGAEIATSLWTGGEHGGNPGSTCTCDAGGPPESGLAVYGVSLLLSLTLLP